MAWYVVEDPAGVVTIVDGAGYRAYSSRQTGQSYDTEQEAEEAREQRLEQVRKEETGHND